jgi:hypothetical protein
MGGLASKINAQPGNSPGCFVFWQNVVKRTQFPVQPRHSQRSGVAGHAAS